jgi:RNA polymerase sigma factor (sigma-70 family)
LVEISHLLWQQRKIDEDRMLRDRGNTDASTAFCPEEDDSLCAQLYRCYAPGILAYLRRHLPMQEDAEDLLLEVFLAALENEPRLATLSEDEQRAWLGTVARNKMIDHHRRAGRRRIFSLEEAKGTLDDDEEKMPEEVVLRDEEHDHLRSHLQLLSVTQREVLLLRFTWGLRCAEIASVLNKREGAVRTMLSRSLNTLRGFYEQKDKGEN